MWRDAVQKDAELRAATPVEASVNHSAAPAGEHLPVLAIHPKCPACADQHARFAPRRRRHHRPLVTTATCRAVSHHERDQILL